jgi:arginine exporter protein ArgO
MKPVWMGIVFLLVYGLFSMKTQAAEEVPYAHAAFAAAECQYILSCQSR